jgi:voltage-gated potassium channel
MKRYGIGAPGKVLIPLALLLFIILTGTFGFMIIQGFSFTEALYMTFITVSTVGFGEVHPLSDGGRLFTIFLIISSLGIVAYHQQFRDCGINLYRHCDQHH